MTSRSFDGRPRPDRLLVLILLIGCGHWVRRQQEAAPAGAAGRGQGHHGRAERHRAPTPTRSARCKGSQEVDLRARVSGILLAKHFEDGALVKEGQLLFSIDAREFRAQVASAQARLASAEANLYRARQDVARYEPLLAEEAIAARSTTTPSRPQRQAQAEVDASRAALEETQLGLDYAEVRSPLQRPHRRRPGVPRAGSSPPARRCSRRSLRTIRPGCISRSAKPNCSTSSVHAGGKELAADDPRRVVQLILSDGSRLSAARAGSTSATARSTRPPAPTSCVPRFPNPDHKLMPGHVRARARQRGGTLENALVVPDRAVQEQLGRYFLTVVGEGDKAELRPVALGPRFGNRQVIHVGPRGRGPRRRRRHAEGAARGRRSR